MLCLPCHPCHLCQCWSPGWRHLAAGPAGQWPNLASSSEFQAPSSTLGDKKQNSAKSNKNPTNSCTQQPSGSSQRTRWQIFQQSAARDGGTDTRESLAPLLQSYLGRPGGSPAPCLRGSPGWTHGSLPFSKREATCERSQLRKPFRVSVCCWEFHAATSTPRVNTSGCWAGTDWGF